MATRTIILLGIMMLFSAASHGQEPDRWIGANVKLSGDATWGTDKAGQSLENLAESGAERGLLVAFTWQAEPDSNDPVIGGDSTPDQVRVGLQQMREAGLEPVLKIHLWIPDHWAGEAEPTDRAAWFAAYSKAVVELARVASEENAAAVVVGSELRGVQNSGYWPSLVRKVRQVYSGKILYVADSLEQAESFRYWSLFDAIGTSLYPSLSSDPAEREKEMRDTAQRLQALSERHQRPVWVAELGVRSAQGSLSAPWESPEQQELPVDLDLQLNVLEAWLEALQTPAIEGIAIWCWYTDPAAGGPEDTDFTVQNKPAQAILEQ